MLRWAIIGVGALILVSDVSQDLKMTGTPIWLLIAQIVRNGLLLGGLIGLALNRKWGYLVLGLSVLLGLVRRSLYLQGLTTPDTWLAVHSGADLVFRLLALAVVADYLRRSK